MINGARVIDMVAETFGVTNASIRGISREARFVEARHVAGHLLMRKLGYSSPQAGRVLGDRDHTTILHGLKKLDERCEADPLFAQLIRTLENWVEARVGSHAHTPGELIALAGQAAHSPRKALAMPVFQIQAICQLVCQMAALAGTAEDLAAEVKLAFSAEKFDREKVLEAIASILAEAALLKGDEPEIKTTRAAKGSPVAKEPAS